jgi:enoyl-CoA hydratase/carnithine racemase
MPTFSTINASIDERGCARIVLNRPTRRNAFDDVMLSELTECVALINDDPSVRVVGVSGAGEHFSAGRELSELATVAARDSQRPLPAAGGHESSMFQDLQPVTIALLDGSVVGGALGFALQCDLRLATSRVRILDGHLVHGMVPSVAAWFLPRMTTLGRALEFIVRDSPVGAEEAHSLGLVDTVVAPEDLEDEFERRAAPFLAADATLLRHAKALLVGAREQTYEHAMERVGLLRAVERLGRDLGAAGSSEQNGADS